MKLPKLSDWLVPIVRADVMELAIEITGTMDFMSFDDISEFIGRAGNAYQAVEDAKEWAPALVHVDFDQALELIEAAMTRVCDLETRLYLMTCANVYVRQAKRRLATMGTAYQELECFA